MSGKTFILTARELCRAPKMAGPVILPHVLSLRILIKPDMQAVPSTEDGPDVDGYKYNFIATENFINVNDLEAAYDTENKLLYITEERYATEEPETFTEVPASAQPDKSIAVNLNWVTGRGRMWVYTQGRIGSVDTIKFTDVIGKFGYVSPVVVLASDAQTVLAELLGDLSFEVVGVNSDSLVVRMTYSHAAIPEGAGLTWSFFNPSYPLSVTLEEDPDFPGDDTVRRMTLPAGIYTFGCTTFYNGGVANAPKSARSMVIEVY